jgi:alcohol dehydrogenase class IV
MIHSYFNPVETYIAVDSLAQLGTFASKYALNKKILVVSDEKLLDILNIRQRILTILEDQHFFVEIFEKPGVFSSIAIIDHGTEIARSGDFGLIIGIGGGSAMDTGKCMAILASHTGSINSFLKDNVPLTSLGIPYIAIPTTSGTGSEVTQWATVWDLQGSAGGKKYSLSDPKMYAQAALIDPSLIQTLPPKMTAMTGLDALSQAIEAYWSRNHNPISDIYALEAIRVIYANLEQSFSHPHNLEFRERMAYGSLVSGLAFSNTKTTAVHSVSYPMTLHYQVPHGLACALTLGEFIVFNSHPGEDNLPEAPSRLATISKLLGGTTPEEARDNLADLMRRMELPTRLHEVKIDDTGIDRILDEGFTPDRVKHNPRHLTKELLKELLHRLQ